MFSEFEHFLVKSGWMVSASGNFAKKLGHLPKVWAYIQELSGNWLGNRVI